MVTFDIIFIIACNNKQLCHKVPYLSTKKRETGQKCTQILRTPFQIIRSGLKEIN